MMELLRFGVLALLLSFVLAGSDTTSSRSAEEYWHSIWPDTSMPEKLKYLLGSGLNDAENKDTQNPYTRFVGDDLHAGKQMNIIFNSPYANEEVKSSVVEKDAKKSSSSLPVGFTGWKRNTVEAKKSSSSFPIGIVGWKRNAVDAEKSSSGFPIGIVGWKRNAVDAEKSSSSFPIGIVGWKRNAVDAEKSSSSFPIGIVGWKKNSLVNDPENSNLEAICNAKERFVGEDDKFCAESMESLLDFVISKLGKDIEALTSSFVPHQTQYTILEGIQRVSSEGVMCHKLNFEKPVFYCHQVNATITYIVPMEAADGTRTSIVALCHHDTRGLEPHMLFHQLKVMPGTVPVCHFLGRGAISWVPRNNELKAAL